MHPQVRVNMARLHFLLESPPHVLELIVGAAPLGRAGLGPPNVKLAVEAAGVLHQERCGLVMEHELWMHRGGSEVQPML